MIWESTLPMAFVDILLLGMVVYAYSGYSRNRRMIKRLGFQPAVVLILLGITISAVFHAADLYIRLIVPLYATRNQATEAMTNLFLNWSWIEAVLGVAAVTAGVMYVLNVSLPKAVSALELRISDLEVVKEITKAVSSKLEPRDLFQTIAREIRKAVPCERCVISSLNEKNRVIHNWHLESEVNISPRLQHEKDFIEWVSREIYEPKRLKNIPDFQDCDLPWSPNRLKMGLRSMILVPILQDDRCVSHLSLSSTRAEAFKPEHEEILTSVASQIGPAWPKAVFSPLAL